MCDMSRYDHVILFILLRDDLMTGQSFFKIYLFHTVS